MTLIRDNKRRKPALRFTAPELPDQWMQRLKRVFNIDIETGAKCQGPIKIAAPAHPCARDIRASLHSRWWWGELQLEIPNKSETANQRTNGLLDWSISWGFGEISEAFRCRQDDISWQ